MVPPSGWNGSVWKGSHGGRVQSGSSRRRVILWNVPGVPCQMGMAPTEKPMEPPYQFPGQLCKPMSRNAPGTSVFTSKDILVFPDHAPKCPDTMGLRYIMANQAE